MSEFVSCHCKPLLLTLILTLAQSPAFAQTAGQAPTSQTSAGDQQVSSEILKKLEAMQKEIEQLQAELKSVKAQQQSANTSVSAAATVPGAARPVSATQPPSPAPAPNVSIAALTPTTALRAAALALPPAAPAPDVKQSPPPMQPSTRAAAAPVEAAAAQKAPAKPAPFSDWDWTWLNGNPRTKEIFWDTPFFTPEIRADINYVNDFNHPTDHTIGGSSELFRSQEVQLEQLGVGGDFHYDNVRARLMTQFGMYSATTPRNDASPGHGNWDLDTAYRYVSEAYGGYHFDKWYGINIDAGIFMSYVGLFSYYNFDNWAYQPSFVSSNTPWFFQGVRVQIFPTEHLKIEPWFINGWQSYASANHRPGLGGQIKWTPFPWMNIISNNYGLGHDDLFVPNRGRIHTDDSVEVKYYDQLKTLDKMAFTFTGDMGCEFGGGVSCDTDTKNGPKQSFLGYMVYNRFWFHKDLFGLTVGGGEINNPGRYLVLLPPINGETAITAATNTPYFTENPGDPFKAWDGSITFDWMPKQYITFRWEGDYRHANVPYWTGRGGITPPGGDTGYPQYYVCSSGASSMLSLLSAAEAACGGGLSSVWFPDLRRDEAFLDFDILVKF